MIIVFIIISKACPIVFTGSARIQSIQKPKLDTILQTQFKLPEL